MKLKVLQDISRVWLYFDHVNSYILIMNNKTWKCFFLIIFQIFGIQLLSQLCKQYALPKSMGVAKLAINIMFSLLSGTCIVQLSITFSLNWDLYKYNYILTLNQQKFEVWYARGTCICLV